MIVLFLDEYKHNILTYMKNLYFIFLSTCIFIFIGCTSERRADTGGALPVIDVNKEYPVKWIDIHELAEVTYIPLETTENSLLQSYPLAVSDSLIIAFDILQSQFHFFDGKGKYLHTINRHGLGPEEYYGATRFDADFEKKEFYVYAEAAGIKIHIYDFNGKYKKTLELQEHTSVEDILNYDSDYLIYFNDSYWPSPDKFRQEADKEPFYLVNKNDGSTRHVDKRLKIDKPVHHVFQMAVGQNGRYSLKEQFYVNHILNNGGDFLLTNNASDTLYSYRNHRLEPVFVRTPSASRMDVPKLITPYAYTDSYFMFGILPMDYEIGKKYHFDNRMGPHYMLDRKTNEIFKVILYDSLLDPEYDIKTRRETWNVFPYQLFNHVHSKNKGIGRYNTEFLLEKLEEGKLSGKLKDLASKLKVDDNNCLAIYKFK